MQQAFAILSIVWKSDENELRLSTIARKASQILHTKRDMTKKTDLFRKTVANVGTDIDTEFAPTESGFRLSLPKRNDLDDYGKTVYDRLIDPANRLVAGLRGPAGIRLHSPKLAAITNTLSFYLRYETGFSGLIRELAILVTAREMDSQFEWAAHEKVALKEGLSQETIRVVKYRNQVEALPETEAVLITFGRQMFGRKHVEPDTFAQMLEIFGPKELVNIVSLMAYYAATALLLTAFDMQLEPGQEPPLPMP